MKFSRILCLIMALMLCLLSACNDEDNSSLIDTNSVTLSNVSDAVSSKEFEDEEDTEDADENENEEETVSSKEKETNSEKKSSSKISEESGDRDSVSSKSSSKTSSKKNTSSKKKTSSISKSSSKKQSSDEDFFDGAVGEITEEVESSKLNVSSKTSSVSKPVSSESVSSKKEEKIDYVDHTFKYLSNFYSKITTQDYVTVTFIGGSVTDGYGSTNAKEYGWPELVCANLQMKFGTEVEMRKKSIGGTGSYLSAFKYNTDTAPSVYTQPDLLFIEHAINDNYIGVSYDDAVKYSESVVRMAYKYNPEVDIVYVLTFDRKTKAEDYEQLRAHRDVAEKYGLMCIKLADGFYSRLSSPTDDIQYIPDGVHPNDEGYSVYAELVLEKLYSDFPRTGIAEPKIVKKTLPNAMSDYYKNPTLIYSNQIDMSNTSGWEFTKAKFSWVGTRFGGRVKATEKGSKLTLEFEGNHFGLLINRDIGMGKISVSIDGKEPVIVDGYRTSSNPSAVPIADGLSNGKHTAVITLIDKTFEIGGLLLN